MLFPICFQHRRHAFEYVVAENEVVDECSYRMAYDQDSERTRTELMCAIEHSLQYRVLGRQGWKLPQKNREWTPS